MKSYPAMSVLVLLLVATPALSFSLLNVAPKTVGLIVDGEGHAVKDASVTVRFIATNGQEFGGQKVLYDAKRLDLVTDDIGNAQLPFTMINLLGIKDGLAGCEITIEADGFTTRTIRLAVDEAFGGEAATFRWKSFDGQSGAFWTSLQSEATLAPSSSFKAAYRAVWREIIRLTPGSKRSMIFKELHSKID